MTQVRFWGSFFYPGSGGGENQVIFHRTYFSASPPQRHEIANGAGSAGGVVIDNSGSLGALYAAVSLGTLNPAYTVIDNLNYSYLLEFRSPALAEFELLAVDVQYTMTVVPQEDI